MKISHKAKQFFLLIIKLLVVALAFYFIRRQLAEKEINWHIITQSLQQQGAWRFVLPLFVLTFANRFIEILKWHNLAQQVKSISVWESTKQVLTAITLGIFTPNGIGEYAGKALFYPKSKAAEIVFLNAVCNGVQVIYAISFGLFGVFYINMLHSFLPPFTGWILIALIVLIILFFTGIRNVRFKGYSLQTLFQNIQKIPKRIHRKNLSLAFLRYTVLLHQYFFLYRFFNVEIPYFILLSVVAAVYLLASSLPNFQALDFALKGSVALFLFGFFDVDEWVVTLVAALIWLLNLVIPISIGSLFVLWFKPKLST